MVFKVLGSMFRGGRFPLYLESFVHSGPCIMAHPSITLGFWYRPRGMSRSVLTTLSVLYRATVVLVDFAIDNMDLDGRLRRGMPLISTGTLREARRETVIRPTSEVTKLRARRCSVGGGDSVFHTGGGIDADGLFLASGRYSVS